MESFWTILFIVFFVLDRAGGRTYGAELEGVYGKELFDLGGQWVGTYVYSQLIYACSAALFNTVLSLVDLSDQCFSY